MAESRAGSLSDQGDQYVHALPTTPTADRSCSLASAVVCGAATNGLALDVNAVHVALGLSMVPCAVPADQDLGDWMMYARDAFVVEAAALFGITLRDLHPPEAARGLAGANEFVQHFDASYKPLIRRALENEQPVICWRGFAGARRLMWGRIVGSCDEGMGFQAETIAGGPTTHSETLETPPVQVYVMETVENAAPCPQDILRSGAIHTQQALAGKVGGRYGVVMGLSAMDAWMNGLLSMRGAGPPRPYFDQGHAQLASSISAGLMSTVHFLMSLQASGAGTAVPIAESLLAGCRNLGERLSRSCDVNFVRQAMAVPAGRDQIVHDLRSARVALIDLGAIIHRAAETL